MTMSGSVIATVPQSRRPNNYVLCVSYWTSEDLSYSSRVVTCPAISQPSSREQVRCCGRYLAATRKPTTLPVIVTDFRPNFVSISTCTMPQGTSSQV